MSQTSVSRGERLRFAIEDAFPLVGLPLAHHLIAALRSGYRHSRAAEIALAGQLSPDHSIRGGPFQGMRYGTRSSGSALLPKLAGTYELEIAAALEDTIARRPDVVIDIGAAEGYYAVGLALRLPEARVIAYETRRSGRYLTGKLSRLNGVLLEIRGRAEAQDVQSALEDAHRPLMLCDIDGGEDALVDPTRIPALAGATIVVETHDYAVPGVTERLRSRFSATHSVEWVPSEKRDASLLPKTASADAMTILDERRPPQGWLLMTRSP